MPSIEPENTAIPHKFTSWGIEKSNLDSLNDYPRTKKRQVWWCAVGQNIGQEQSSAERFERPVLVIRAFGGLFWGLPITSSDSTGKKADNPLFYKLDGITYKNATGEEKNLRGYVALHQLRVFDGRRLKRKILKLEAPLFDAIFKRVRDLL